MLLLVRPMVISMVLAALATCSAMSLRSATFSLAPSSGPSRSAPHTVAIGHFGIGCLTAAGPEIGPASYLVADVGRRGAPSLNASERRMVKAIREYVSSRTLRIAFLPRVIHFMVFDATQGPCMDIAPGYWVMNSRAGNLFYEPGEAPGFVHAVPAGAMPTAGPWMWAADTTNS